MSGRKPSTRVEIKLAKAWLSMADNLALMTAQTRAAYIRSALIRQMMADWQTTPGRGFWLRPRQPVFARDGDTFRQVAETLGGERCWPIEGAGRLPGAAGGNVAYRCDIVPVGQAQGLTMSDAIVGRDSFGGPV